MAHLAERNELVLRLPLRHLRTSSPGLSSAPPHGLPVRASLARLRRVGSHPRTRTRCHL
eukprot:COSAG05_NODE_808_length_7189_cov_16.336530_1_plen_59_part_00